MQAAEPQQPHVCCKYHLALHMLVRAIKLLMPIVCTFVQNPALAAWEGMSLFVSSGDYARVAMTKAQYEETGGSAARGQR